MLFFFRECAKWTFSLFVHLYVCVVAKRLCLVNSSVFDYVYSYLVVVKEAMPLLLRLKSLLFFRDLCLL